MLVVRLGRSLATPGATEDLLWVVTHHIWRY